MVKVEIQEQLAEALLQAQTALKEFGEGKNDDDVTIDDFEEMIVDELNEEGIPVSDERIVAVAEWVPICIEDNGIYIATAIIECVESSIDELMNIRERYKLEEIIMNYVVTIKNNKFTFENSGWNTEKMWNDLINALQSMKLASEVETVEFSKFNESQLGFDGEVSQLLEYVKGEGIITSWHKE